MIEKENEMRINRAIDVFAVARFLSLCRGGTDGRTGSIGICGTYSISQ